MCWPPTGMTSAKQQSAVLQDRDAGGGAAHFDQGGAELLLVIDEGRLGGGIGSDDEACDA